MKVLPGFGLMLSYVLIVLLWDAGIQNAPCTRLVAKTMRVRFMGTFTLTNTRTDVFPVGFPTDQMTSEGFAFCIAVPWLLLSDTVMRFFTRDVSLFFFSDGLMKTDDPDLLYTLTQSKRI